MALNTIILIIFPYAGYKANSKLENNFWELIDKCQKHSKYKPIVVINRDTINSKKAYSFFQKNKVDNNNIVNTTNTYSLLNENPTDDKKIVDTLKVWSVDTCQMWLHGWGKIIDENKNLDDGEKIEKIIQLPGDIEKITEHDEFYKKLEEE